MDRSLFLELIDDSRSARSVQKAVGPSEIGGCRRQVWHRLQGTPVLNETLGMAAWMGTAIHSELERRLKKRDPFGQRFLREVEVAYDGLMGHVDVYDTEEFEVIDWKTVKKANLKYFPEDEKWQQVHLYGYLLSKNGYRVDTVTLVGIPRDGTELDVVIESAPYDEFIALEGIRWLRDVEQAFGPPAPERNAARFCSNYCNFYDPSGRVGCEGGS